MADTPPPKVFLAGFNKCATRSFAELFEAAGLPAMHHKLRRRFRPTALAGRLVDENVAVRRRPFEGFEDFALYADLIHVTPTIYSEGNRHFRKVLDAYPEAIVVLNTRDREDWIRSRFNHGHGEFARRAMQALKLADEAALADRWRADWDAQHAAVRAAAPRYPGRIHEFDLDRDAIADLIAALPEMGLDPAGWGDTGRSRGQRKRGLKPAAARLWAHVRPRRRR